MTIMIIMIRIIIMNREAYRNVSSQPRSNQNARNGKLLSSSISPSNSGAGDSVTQRRGNTQSQLLELVSGQGRGESYRACQAGVNILQWIEKFLEQLSLLNTHL